METQRVERRLSAVLAADVVGYSRLIGIDEEGTLERLRSIRLELIDPAIATHHGRIIKTTGDGILVEFPSVVDAVRCALAVQRSMAERNAEIAADRLIALRIGIHLGDVVVDGATCWATASTSRRGWKASRTRAESVFRRMSGARSATSCRRPSSIW